MRPLSVDILLNNQPLSSDRTYDIECQAIGSKPSAKITWWMNGVQLRSFREKVCQSKRILFLSHRLSNVWKSLDKLNLTKKKQFNINDVIFHDLQFIWGHSNRNELSFLVNIVKIAAFYIIATKKAINRI